MIMINAIDVARLNIVATEYLHITWNVVQKICLLVLLILLLTWPSVSVHMLHNVAHLISSTIILYHRKKCEYPMHIVVSIRNRDTHRYFCFSIYLSISLSIYRSRSISRRTIRAWAAFAQAFIKICSSFDSWTSRIRCATRAWLSCFRLSSSARRARACSFSDSRSSRRAAVSFSASNSRALRASSIRFCCARQACSCA